MYTHTLLLHQEHCRSPGSQRGALIQYGMMWPRMEPNHQHLLQDLALGQLPHHSFRDANSPEGAELVPKTSGMCYVRLPPTNSQIQRCSQAADASTHPTSMYQLPGFTSRQSGELFCVLAWHRVQSVSSCGAQRTYPFCMSQAITRRVQVPKQEAYTPNHNYGSQ